MHGQDVINWNYKLSPIKHYGGTGVSPTLVMYVNGDLISNVQACMVAGMLYEMQKKKF